MDEYQDVNPLQQALLDVWLGDRSDVCVVGDDYQTVYGFTGANPLSGDGVNVIGFTTRRPSARHQRNKLACRTGSRNETGSSLAAAAPAMRACISASLLAPCVTGVVARLGPRNEGRG